MSASGPLVNYTMKMKSFGLGETLKMSFSWDIKAA